MIAIHGHAPRRVVAPAVMPVSLAEAKAHLRVEHVHEDAAITGMIAAAVDHLDGWSGILGRCLIDQTWEMLAGGWPANRCFTLPFPDCSAPVVTYRDAAGATQTLDAALYVLIEGHGGSQILFFADAPLPALDPRHPAPVTLRFVAGYGAADTDVPQALRSAILILTGDLYSARESFVIGARVTSTPSAATVERLVAPFRRSGLGL